MSSNVMVWNVRGLGGEGRQNIIRKIIKDNNISVCGLVETHLGEGKVLERAGRINNRWNWVCNSEVCENWVRIVVGWDPRKVCVDILGIEEQVIHCRIKSFLDGENFLCSFVYGHATMNPRRALWRNLIDYSGNARDKPWVAMGDFNAILHLNEKSSVQRGTNYGMEEFKECVAEANIMDIAKTGFHFTWNQKPGSSDGIMEKLDRVMGNEKFLNDFPSGCAKFLPFYTSDHSPAILVFSGGKKFDPKPFKFWNFLASKPEFKPIVKEVWDKSFVGHNMFKVVCKLKELKKPLRKLNRQQGNLNEKVERLRSEVERIQSEIACQPDNEDLRLEEVVYVKAFKEALLDQEYLLKQKSRENWLKVGDQNTKYFHQVVKHKQVRNHVGQIRDLEGNIYEGKAVGDAFV
ncbi:uncharacterized protein LOC110880693 [Helianthus annuus]|uniref:uncharacterized protein LOC110880693 n=1 Tax=Helianthus annuus TaxID=4232 RepID=UPI000B9012ED|nr:uncharacterized protein LOC110880693 [Helianthus annuus]